LAQHVRAIKIRIGNIENIGQITKAMNAIAMTKVTRMKRRLAQVRPYMEGLEGFTRSLLGQQSRDAEPHPLMVDNGSQETAVFVLNSDRGMCGRYKGELNRAADDAWREASPHGVLIAGGEKARSYFERRGVKPVRSYVRVYDTPEPDAVERMADDAMDLYLRGEVGSVRLIWMRFVSDLAQRLAVEDWLPVRLDPSPGEFLVEPDVETVLEQTLPLYVRAKLYAAVLETKTSEDAIRRQAMKSATDNAEDLLTVLTRSYNKARQQSITREIADIIGGAEALRTD
jgi:F-type H+-transporting ATPase subunit gamma